MRNELFFSSKSVEWYTPPDFLQQVDTFFAAYKAERKGYFEPVLDPCSNTLLQAKGYGIEKWESWVYPRQSAFDKSWGRSGRTVFCNPPYGRQLQQFLQTPEAHKSFNLWLLPARTDTKWFHAIMRKEQDGFTQACLMIEGRLKYRYPATQLLSKEEEKGVLVIVPDVKDKMALVDTKTNQTFRTVAFKDIEILEGNSAAFPSILIADNMPDWVEPMFRGHFSGLGTVFTKSKTGEIN